MRLGAPPRALAAALGNALPITIAAEAGVNAVFVVDAWHESHMPLARRYLELCQRYGLGCRLSEQRPAEVYAVELCEAECGEGCAVVTRDYDAVIRAGAAPC